MSAPQVEVQIAGMNLRVPKGETADTPTALVNKVHAKLKELESRSTKVNTQAFALQAAYEFALEVAELKDAYAATESRLVESIEALHERVKVLRKQIEEGSNTAKA
ncbi:MAG: cell division protein ZapA [Candidatus Hydrogenedentes bacterium]|nr:cell division protein ZapA [Candidatus Hydrogenedentota bacterium]